MRDWKNFALGGLVIAFLIGCVLLIVHSEHPEYVNKKVEMVQPAEPVPLR